MTDPDPWTRRRFLGAGAAGLAGLALVGCSGLDGSGSKDNDVDRDAAFGGDLIDPPFEMPDRTLTALDGSPYPLREKTKGKLTLLFFGYTHCPDQCPVYLNTLARAREAIGSGPGSRPLVLFVGVDTERDTPEVMTKYLERIDGTFVGLTGTPEEIAKPYGDLGFGTIEFGEPDAKGDYLVGHIARGVAYTPDGKGRRFYDPSVRQQEFVRDLPRLDEGVYR
jgi:protein SCO1/2